MKTVSWGVERVDNAMVPILARIKELQAELAELPEDPGQELAANAVARWQAAVANGDVLTQRTMVKRTVPKLTLDKPRRRNDYSAERIMWHGVPARAEAGRAGRIMCTGPSTRWLGVSVG
jgi:hypothetical protein